MSTAADMEAEFNGFQNAGKLSIETASASSTVDDDILTPTSTATYTGMDHEKTDDTGVTPWPGNNYIIRARGSGLTITLVDGKLCLSESFTTHGGFHWTCVEKNGWLGFRNCVSGRYIGHDGKGKFIANVTHHQGFEFFCARKHPEGGYVLLTRHGEILWKMAIGPDKSSLVETKGEGTRWDFFKG